MVPKPRSPSPRRSAVTEDPAAKRLAGGGGGGGRGGGGGGGLKRQGATSRSSGKAKSPSLLDASDKPMRTEVTNGEYTCSSINMIMKAKGHSVSASSCPQLLKQKIALQNNLNKS